MPAAPVSETEPAVAPSVTLIFIGETPVVLVVAIKASPAEPASILIDVTRRSEMLLPAIPASAAESAPP